MAQQHIRADTGPIIIQQRVSGADPTQAPKALYLAGNWEFVPATTLTRLLGPRGTPIGVIPFVGEQMINIEVTGETGFGVEAARLLGDATFSAASTDAAAHMISAYAVGGAVKNRSGLINALAAVGGASLDAAAVGSVYEMRLEVTAVAAINMPPTVSGALYRISPVIERISGTTNVFMTALDADDYASFYPNGSDAEIGDTAKIIFDVDEPSDGAVELTWDNPQVPLTKITCMSGRESGNSFAYLEADNCVPIDASFSQERGAVPGIPTSFLCLGAGARFRQIDFSRANATNSGNA